MSEKIAETNWNGIGWPEWEEKAGEVWDFYRSRFATSWEGLAHHDRVSFYRVLMAATREATE